MNERINDLFDKALDEVVPNTWTNLTMDQLNDIKNKFAELIVKDCYVALFPALRDMVSRRQAYEMIEKHFGVGKQQINIGSRIKVLSGFNVGAKGTVNYIEPTGRLWVRRDGASSDVFYLPEEVGLDQ